MCSAKSGIICLERRCLRYLNDSKHHLFCFINVEYEIFSRLYTMYLQVDFADTNIVITEPYFNFSSIQESMNEILFEEYQFQSALRINGKFSALVCSLLRLFMRILWIWWWDFVFQLALWALTDTFMRKMQSCVALWWTAASPSHTSFLIAGEERWRRESAGD